MKNTMKKLLRAAVTFALTGCMMAAPAFAAVVEFNDVPASYWGYEFISRAAQEGIVAGRGNGIYAPEDTVSNAEFITMVCNVLYKEETEAYRAENTPAEWWYPFIAVAEEKGLLKSTAIGSNHLVGMPWSASVVSEEINRYDMAQIMVNAAEIENWTMPDSTALLEVQAKIKDWAGIPENYQTAVSTAYAKGFLSGMDDQTFSGGNLMTRAQSAVVVCRLLDANGKITERKIDMMLKELQEDFPNNYVWNLKTSYTSEIFGKGTKGNAFIYMLSDQMFGELEAKKIKADELKAGDVVYLNREKAYVLVTEVSEDEFTYVSCSNKGKVSWDNTWEIEDLTQKDIIYSRYAG